MARVHCPDCGIDVVLDPAGRCPEGHLVTPPVHEPGDPGADTPAGPSGAGGAGGAPAAAASGDERTPPADDELREALEALSTEPPDHATADDAGVTGAGLPTIHADPPPAVPADTAPTADDERDDIQATLAALGVEAATEQRSSQSAQTDRGNDDRPAAGGQAPATPPGPAGPADRDTGIDVGNFTAKGGRVGRGARRRWSRR